MGLCYWFKFLAVKNAENVMQLELLYLERTSLC